MASVKMESKPKTEVATCVHHWKIEPPTNATSKGICQKCGEEKEFINHFFDNETEN